MAGPGLTQFIFNNIIILKNKKKIKTLHFSKGILKIFVGPPRVFPIILYNIGLYIYTRRYRSNTKNTRFQLKVKKKSKISKKITFKKKMFCFSKKMIQV
jgi:hypothetical protein